MKHLLLTLFLFFSIFTYSQPSDSISQRINVVGNIGITNNGISIVPTFSLNAPASNFTFSVQKNRFSFDPDIRLTLDGKKGDMMFWFRYRLVQSQKWSLGVGVHPAYNFAGTTLHENGIDREIIQSRRFVGLELAPFYAVSPHVGFGPYFLRGMGLQKDGPIVTNFVAMNLMFSNLNVSKNLQLSVMPQLYYLYLDHQDGLYLAGNIKLSSPKSPFALHSTMNKVVKTQVAGSKNFSWNLIFSYSFAHSYKKA